MASIVLTGRRKKILQLNSIPIIHLWICFLYFSPAPLPSKLHPEAYLSGALAGTQQLLAPLPSPCSDASADCIRTWCQTASQPSPAERETPTARGQERGWRFLELSPLLMCFDTLILKPLKTKGVLMVLLETTVNAAFLHSSGSSLDLSLPFHSHVTWTDLWSFGPGAACRARRSVCSACSAFLPWISSEIFSVYRYAPH